jgi:GNAT superfamily N-acetyltransferase
MMNVDVYATFISAVLTENCVHIKMNMERSSMAKTNIRIAAPQDIGAILELCHAHAVHEQAAICGNLLDETSLKELLFSQEALVSCLVAEFDGTIVGYATFSPQFSTWHARKYMYLDCLYLHESARGHGLGREIMHRVRAESRKAGCDHVQWQTPTFNPKAIEFYQRLGAVAKPKQRFLWPVEPIGPTESEDGTPNSESRILGPAESLSISYRPRHTRLSEVRSVNDWQLKIYQITLDGEPISGEIVEAAMECVAMRSIWPTDLTHQYGFVILHQGKEAVWTLNKIWVNDILRQFFFFAALDDPTAFDYSLMPGFNACVWDLEVTKHERDAWVRHVMTNPAEMQFDEYLNDSLEIEFMEKQTT